MLANHLIAWHCRVVRGTFELLRSLLSTNLAMISAALLGWKFKKLIKLSFNASKNMVSLLKQSFTIMSIFFLNSSIAMTVLLLLSATSCMITSPDSQSHVSLYELMAMVLQNLQIITFTQLENDMHSFCKDATLRHMSYSSRRSRTSPIIIAGLNANGRKKVKADCGIKVDGDEYTF